MKDTRNAKKHSVKTTKKNYTLDDLLELTRKKGQASDKCSSENFGEKLAEKALERIRKEVII